MTLTTTTVHNSLPPRAQEALSRASRQALQAAVPTLIVLAGGTATGIDVLAVFELCLVAAVVSLLKSIASLKLSASAPVWQQLTERAATAAAGTALGFITVDGTIPDTDIPWGAALTASLGAAGVALAMFYLQPPTVAVGSTPTSAPLDDDPGPLLPPAGGPRVPRQRGEHSADRPASQASQADDGFRTDLPE